MESTNEVPEVVTLTLDKDLEGPDWKKVRSAANAKNAFPDTIAAIRKIQGIWENPKAGHLTMIDVRDSKTLVIGEGPGEVPRYHRLMVNRLKRLGAIEAGGFDGPLAGGTRDRTFAIWFTPDVIWEEINDDPELNEADFDQSAIEDAIRHLVCHDDGDWTFDFTCQVRSRIIEVARVHCHRKVRDHGVKQWPLTSKTATRTLPACWPHDRLRHLRNRRGEATERRTRMPRLQRGPARLRSSTEPRPAEPHGRARVTLKRDIERFPHFIAPAGTTGTVNDINNDTIAMGMDTVIEGAAEWDNDLVWTDDQLDVIGDELALIEPQQKVVSLNSLIVGAEEAPVLSRSRPPRRRG